MSWLQFALGLMGGVVLTILSWAAIFAAASTAGATADPVGAVALLAGVVVGSLSWFAVLTGVVSLAVRQVRGVWSTVVDLVSGLGLVCFGAVLGVRSVREV